MYVELNNRKYHLNEPFNHKVSELRKKSTLKIEIGIYVQEDEVDNMYSTFADIIDNNLLFFENLKSLPDFLYFHNTYYFWIFETTNLEKVNITEDRNYRESISRFFGVRKDQRKFTVSIEFTYKQVWGTNNRVMFDRDLLLRNILD
jgi:hypothetical protein